MTIVVSLLLRTVFKKDVQMPWWGLLFAAALAFIFTLSISIITATTNKVKSLILVFYDLIDLADLVALYSKSP